MKISKMLFALQRFKNIFGDEMAILTDKGYVVVSIGSQFVQHNDINITHAISGLKDAGWKVDIQDYGVAGMEYVFYLGD